MRPSPQFWFAAYVVALTCVLIGSALYLATCAVRATELPVGLTCAQVVQLAGNLQIPDTQLGRAQARVIALTFGVVLTGAQLDEAARCLRQHRQDREDR